MTETSHRSKYLRGVKRVMDKVGTGVLTRGTGLDLRVISRLADEMSLLRDQGLELILVSSGAVAAGADKLGLGSKPKHLPWLQAAAGAEGGAWGLGGMKSKVQAAYKAALGGIPAVIAGGKRENVVRDILAGRPVGTFFKPQWRVSGRKHWIAFTPA
ncbi:MAG: hypothetical protein JRJ59_08820, partial [Deltaproteobacteria bacterium]|nr:hypothetical protein [Deltaproteobacteria bacterium]